MKCIDMSGYSIVKAGLACISETPIRLDKLLAMMERNESYIYWLQPQDADVNAQIPAISINGKFYHPNLRLEKAIFRHVRLSRDFDNKELLEDGTPKLRIPVRLMREKVKSSIRFQVPRVCVSIQFACCQCSSIKSAWVYQGMPQKSSTQKPKRAVARGVSKDASKIKINRPELLRNHEDVRVAMMRGDAEGPAVGTSLVLTPRTLVRDMQRSFELEFPLFAGRAHFFLDAE